MRCKQTWTETIMEWSLRNRKNRYLRNFNFHDLPASIRTHGNKKFMYQMKKNISNLVLYFNQYQISNILVSRTFTHIMCVLPCFVTKLKLYFSSAIQLILNKHFNSTETVYSVYATELCYLFKLKHYTTNCLGNMTRRVATKVYQPIGVNKQTQNILKRNI